MIEDSVNTSRKEEWLKNLIVSIICLAVQLATEAVRHLDDVNR